MVGLLGQMGWLWWRRRSGTDGLDGDEGDEAARAVEEGLLGEKRNEAEDRGVEERKLVRGMGWWFAELVPFVVARVWVLGWKVEWFDG